MVRQEISTARNPSVASEHAGRASAPRGFVECIVTALDALFGPLDDVHGPSAWLRYLGLSAALLAIIVARRPDIVTNPQFFAEDGLLFFPQNILLGPRAFLELYHGFPYFAHRLIAAIGGLVPAAYAPRVYCTAAAVLPALGLAAFVLPGFRHLLHRDGLRAFFTLGVATLPLVPFDEQTLGTAANVGWFLAIWLTLSAVMRRPRTAWATTGLALTATGAALSTPLAAVNVPLWTLRLLRGLARRDRLDACYAGLPLVVFCATVAATPNLGAHSTFEIQGTQLSMTPATVAAWLVTRASLFVAPLAAVRTIRDSSAVGLPILAGIVAVALLLLGARNARSRPALAVGIYGFVASGGITLLGRPALTVIDPLIMPARYGVFPAAMLCLAVVASLDALTARWALRGATAAVVALAWWVRQESFFIPPLVDLRWQDQAERFDRVLREPCPVRLRIPLNPLYAPMDVIWGPEFSDRATFGVAADLRGGVRLTQSFVSQCEGLSEVGFDLAAVAPSDAGGLRLELHRAGEATPIAIAVLSGGALRQGWNVLCFPPVTNSRDAQFVVALRAVDPDGASAVLLQASAHDPNAEGEARLDGSPVNTRAALVHGCVDRRVPSVPIIDNLQRQ